MGLFKKYGHIISDDMALYTERIQGHVVYSVLLQSHVTFTIKTHNVRNWSRSETHIIHVF